MRHPFKCELELLAGEYGWGGRAEDGVEMPFSPTDFCQFVGCVTDTSP